ncbi:F-box protein [Salix suchowensis]|nr:F-box protein [Salix suchowensis]
MLLSLFLQTILAFFGDRRKYATGFWLRSVVWLAYMSADWVATFSLGILARSQTNSANPNLIPVFWAPVLLLHLGGPETITAYSLPDNELWIRRLLELVIQAGVVSYVLFKLWSRNTIIFVAIPIFVSGIIKYGERIWSFRLANSENFSQLAANLPCIPSKEFVSSVNQSPCEETGIFHEARLLYRTFQMLSSNLILGNLDNGKAYEMVSGKKAEEAFALTEIELGFMYNRLHSKVTEISRPRIILHSITCLSSISALISFSIMTTSKNVYSKNDTMISYLLLVGAVLLDCYSITVFFLSDWGIIWLSGCEKEFPILYRILCLSSLPPIFRKRKRWSNSMGQHNLISALSKKPVNKLWKQYFPGNWNIHDRVGHCFDKVRWSLDDAEFSHSLLTWHIAIHICFLDDTRKNIGFESTDSNLRMSISLSNYMLYLIVQCPTMLGTELSGRRYTVTTTHLRRLLHGDTDKKGAHSNISMDDQLDTLWFPEAKVRAFFYELLGSPSTMLRKIEEEEGGGGEKYSALLDGCMLGLSLQSLETVNGRSDEKKWEMISKVWVEMLMYAATHCGWKQHADALARGGELLTHVCLLMAHLGLSKQCPPALSSQVEDRKKGLDGILHDLV